MFNLVKLHRLNHFASGNLWDWHTPAGRRRQAGKAGRRSRGNGKQIHEKTQKPLELKSFKPKDKISPPSERHDLNAKASEDKQKASFRSFQRLSALLQGFLFTHHNDSKHPARWSQILIFFILHFSLFFLPVNGSYNDKGLTVIFIKTATCRFQRDTLLLKSSCNALYLQRHSFYSFCQLWVAG